jgi:hypothetical protein
MLGLIAMLLIGGVIGALVIENLASSPPAAGRPVCGSGAMLADDLIARAIAPGVRGVELVPTGDRAIYRTETDDAVVDLGTPVGGPVAVEIAREFATRAGAGQFPQRLVVGTAAGRVPLMLDLRRNPYGWIISLRRFADDPPPAPFTYTNLKRRTVSMPHAVSRVGRPSTAA